MTHRRLLLCGVTKEIRALLPTWLACAGAMAIVALLDDRKVYVLGVLAYFFGSVALGALSIGHEYTHRTLTLLLSQPAHRGRLFLVKLGVLTAMLLLLAAFAWGVLFNPRELYWTRYGAGNSGALTILVSVLCGLFIAPWLTMLCRSPLAGVVFTISTLGSLWILSELFAIGKYGSAAASLPKTESLKLMVLRQGMLGLCAVAAVASWRTFLRLEAIEGRSPDVRLPRWLRALIAAIAAATGFGHARNRHPIWLLAKKELRLQQMAFVVAGLNLALWVTVTLLRHILPDFVPLQLGALTILYGGLLALLIGSLASAEERQFGTLEWQVLLPIAMWKQWAVKVGVTLGLALLLALGLPALLMSIDQSPFDIRNIQWSASAVIVLTAGSLYVSSLCTSGLRALLLSFPVLLGVILLFGPAVETFVRLFIQVAPSEWTGGRVKWLLWLRPSLPLVLAGGFLALVLPFALVNHRSAERGAVRVWRQAISIVGCMMLGVTLLAVVLTVY